MQTLKTTRAQIRYALIAVVFVFTVGVVGFMWFEDLEPLDALWLTTMTLTTVGYGDIHAQTQSGHIFTIILVLTGFGVVAYGLQATATFFVSPIVREVQARRRVARKVKRIEGHYIICGTGELVDQTLSYLLSSVSMRLSFYDSLVTARFDVIFGRILALGLGKGLRRLYLWFFRRLRPIGTLLDHVVVVTPDYDYAQELREKGFSTIIGQPSDDDTLLSAGVQKAQALMVIMESDTETFLTVITGRSQNANLHIVAATREDLLADKITRAGANSVIRPFEIAGLLLNNVTLRPAVNQFFNDMLFDLQVNTQITQVSLHEGSAWIGQTLNQLALDTRLNARILAKWTAETGYEILPEASIPLTHGAALILVAPSDQIATIHRESREGVDIGVSRSLPNFTTTTLNPSAMPIQTSPTENRTPTTMRKHFIVCVTNETGINAVNQLDPTRPFIIVSDIPEYADELISRGFVVVKGDSTHEDILQEAGIDRALAIMVALENEADSLLTVLTARSLNDAVLITTTASATTYAQKLSYAGADRVIRPFEIAAQFVLLTTTRPIVSGFFRYVLYNRIDGIETTELYMDSNASWVGKSLESLELGKHYQAHIIGIRHMTGQIFYAPEPNTTIKHGDVLIIVTPMEHADTLREAAHGSATARPDSIRLRKIDPKSQ